MTSIEIVWIIEGRNEEKYMRVHYLFIITLTFIRFTITQDEIKERARYCEVFHTYMLQYYIPLLTKEADNEHLSNYYNDNTTIMLNNIMHKAKECNNNEILTKANDLQKTRQTKKIESQNKEKYSEHILKRQIDYDVEEGIPQVSFWED